MRISRLLATLGLVATLAAAASCNCTPNTDADPDCKSGLQESATLTIDGQLDDIRPVDGDKDIQVRGNRLSTDPCLETGAQSAFSVRLQGDTTTSEVIPSLAPGSWRLNIAALSGGSHDPIEQTVSLPNGGLLAITLAANEEGDMVLQ